MAEIDAQTTSVTIIVIGNGFDLSRGYKTSYSDFIKSVQFDALIDSGSRLAVHLSAVHESKNWVDIEHELANFANKIKPELNQLKFEFTNLKIALTNYLEIAVARKNDSRVGTSNFSNINERELLGVFTLNFTTSAFDICQDRQKLHFVHGTTYHKNIVFGVADGSIHDEKYGFLYKSDHHAYGSVNLSKAIQDADVIHFYGLSFGDTDNNHFLPAFSNLRDKKLFFYVYGLQGYEDVRNRLTNLTKNGLAALKTNNSVKFFDTFNGYGTEITQEWLNEKYLSFN